MSGSGTLDGGDRAFLLLARHLREPVERRGSVEEGGQWLLFPWCVPDFAADDSRLLEQIADGAFDGLIAGHAEGWEDCLARLHRAAACR
jgi:hypothetical protein